MKNCQGREKKVPQCLYQKNRKEHWNENHKEKNKVDVYTFVVYTFLMIRSFADRETEKVYNQTFSKKLPQNIQSVALRKLIMIDNAGCLEDLRVPPANRLEKLEGDRKGQYSIRINDQYRICFTVEGNNFFDVEIVDYH